MKPNTWTRIFAQITFPADTDISYDGGYTLSANINDSVTSLVVNGTFPAPDGFSAFGPRTGALCGGVQCVGTRKIKIGSEIMIVTQTTAWSATQQTLTVTRGTDGTSAADHTASDVVYARADKVSMWVADENTDPVAIVLDMPHYFGESGRSQSFGIEQNTSVDRVSQERADAGFPTLTGYVRDFILLGKSGAVDAGWSALRVKPTAGGN
jgi:hypothetical protein